jgi:glycosyltransferase involved in cell wall biosynthesis
METVLFLTTVWPGARRSGGELISQGFIDAMRDGGRRVVVVAYRRQGERSPGHPDDAFAGERPIETRYAGPHAIAWLGRALLRGLPYSAAKYVSTVYRGLVEASIGAGVDLVVIDHAQTAWAMSALPPALPRAYLAHNVEHHLYSDNATAGRGLRRLVYLREARRVRALELQAFTAAAGVWALSADDASALEVLGAPGPVRVFAPPPVVTRVEGSPEADVVLLGRWSWAANSVGLEWFLDQVVAHLPPTLRVEVAGVGAERFHGRHANVTIVGSVDDAARFLSRGRVIAVPARAGAGVQVKTLDAIAMGRPVVATSLAVRGLADFPPTVRVADDPIAFAQALALAAGAQQPPSDLEAVHTWMLKRRCRFRGDVQDALSDALR